MALSLSQHYIATSTATTTVAKASVVVASGEGIVVLVHASDAAGTAQTITGVTWNAAAMTQIGNALTSADGVGAVHRQACFCIPSPTPGTQTVTATFGGSSLVGAMEVFVVAGHDTTTMVRGHVGSAVGAATAATTNLTTVSGDLVLDLERTRQSSTVMPSGGPSGGQTQLDSAVSPASGSWFHLASSKVASSTTTTMSWVDASDSAWNTQACAVMVAAASGVTLANLERRDGRGSFRGQL